MKFKILIIMLCFGLFSYAQNITIDSAKIVVKGINKSVIVKTQKQLYQALNAVDNSKYKQDAYLVVYYLSNGKTKEYLFCRIRKEKYNIKI